MNYAKFTSADKTRFDNETKGFVECDDCVKNYLVTIRTPTGPSSDATITGVDPIWTLKGLSLADLKPYVHLVNDGGEQRELVHFVPPEKPGGEAMFVFPRLDSAGKALVTTTNKKFRLKIDEKLFDKRSIPMKSFTFEVARLTLSGDLVF